MNSIADNKTPPQRVIDVWSTNFHAEMRNLEHAIKCGYNILAIDTEYPGVIFKQKFDDRTITGVYTTMKANVDALKPIQVGIALCDEMGGKPTPICTWQFNLRFDCKIDAYEPTSIQLLSDARISFPQLSKNGIDAGVFKDVFEKGLLIANPNLIWLSFHGAYDFAYLIKLATGTALPASLKGFNEVKKFIFPCVYDVKMLIQPNDAIRNYSLGKLARLYEVSAPGPLHQAGTDAYITAELFFRIKQSLLDQKIKKFENKLYGLSKMFSIDSAEFEGKPIKKTLAQRIKSIKLEREREEAMQNEIQIIPQVVYGMYVMPGYYNPYYGVEDVQDYTYKPF